MHEWDLFLNTYDRLVSNITPTLFTFNFLQFLNKYLCISHRGQHTKAKFSIAYSNFASSSHKKLISPHSQINVSHNEVQSFIYITRHLQQHSIVEQGLIKDLIMKDVQLTASETRHGEIFKRKMCIYAQQTELNVS